MEMFLFVVILLTECAILVNSNSSWLCLLPDGDGNKGLSSVCEGQFDYLECPEGQVIMINNITYSAKVNGSGNNCSDCSRVNFSPWQTESNSLRWSLHENCSKKDKCSFQGTVENPVAWPYIWYADIDYNCVKEDLFRDMRLSWEEASVGNKGLHVILGAGSNSLHQCSCLIEAVVGSVHITVVDYRPCMDDITCADNTFYVNGKRYFQSSTTTDKDYSVYNEPVTVNNNITNITITIHSSPPLMLWYFIEGTQQAYVRCNKGSLEATLSTVTSDKLSTTSTSLKEQSTS